MTQTQPHAGAAPAPPRLGDRPPGLHELPVLLAILLLLGAWLLLTLSG